MEGSSFLRSSTDSFFSSDEPSFFEGSLERLENGSWTPYWFVLKIDKLYFYDINSCSRPQRISLNSVQKVKKLGDSAGRLYLVLCTEEKDPLQLRASSKEEGNKWLFGFQKCVVFQSIRSQQISISQKPRRATAEMIYGSPVKSEGLTKSFSANALHQLLHHAPSLQIAIEMEQGRRKTMEDRCIIFEDLNDTFDLEGFPPQALFGVYDGHSGVEAVDFVVRNLPKLLVAHPLFNSHPLMAFEQVHQELDAQFLALAKQRQWKAGTTTLTALIRGDTLFLSHAGDCRAVLCRDDKAICLTKDHVPSRLDEKLRIEEAGGWVDSAEVLNIPKLYRLHLEDEDIEEHTEELIGWVTVQRVNGCLGMTRSIGDILIKDLKEEHFGRKFNGELVVPTPEVTSITLDPSRDKFLILASDGLWNVFGNQEAIEFVRFSLLRQKEVQTIVEELVSMAVELGSLDNITVVLIHFTN